ncbi:MAG: OB-fold nucleic acid binding domain-containing protein, partial [Flavobacteriaceae bacterium]
MDPLQTPIAYLKGVGPSRATLLQSELGIHTFQDLLHCFPHRYIDRSTTFSIANLPQNNAEVQLIGRITDLQIIPQKRGKRLSVQVEDGSGTLELVWFRGYKWIMEGLRKNEPYVIFGRLNWFNGRVSIPHPELELLSQFEKGPKIALKPLYPSTEKLTTRGVSQRIMQKMMTELMKATQSGFTESLSLTIIEQWQLMPKKDALFQIHFPQSHNALSKAQFRLKFEELFYIQLQLLKKNSDRKQKIK